MQDHLPSKTIDQTADSEHRRLFSLSSHFFRAKQGQMKAGVEYCETVLWELIESGASASDSLGATSYSDFLADSAKRGAKEKGRGALVLSAPVHALKSWFELIERKLNSGQKLLTEELVNISKAGEFSSRLFDG
jgi:hypothetical protein